MDYRIKRGEQEFGPYSLAELKQYFAEGRIIPTDLAISEGMQDWTPVSQVMGDLELPGAAVAQVGAAGASVPAGPATAMPGVPLPPDLHWALVLLLTLVTCGLFMMIWMFIQANWAKKIDPENKSMLLFAIYIGGVFTAAALGFAAGVMLTDSLANLATFVNLAGAICAIVGYFKIKDSMENRFGGPPLHLNLNGVLTFFLNIFYIQYHFTRISRWLKTGVIT